eukprot:gene29075-64859_t
MAPGAIGKAETKILGAAEKELVVLEKKLFRYPQWLIPYVESALCLLSMLVSTYVCVMMSVVMIVFIATFRGDINDLLLKVVIVAHARLDNLYTRNVNEQTELRDEETHAKVKWMRVLYPRHAAVFSGLVLYVGIAWVLISFYVDANTGAR